MFEDSFSLAALKAGLTLLVIVLVFGLLALDAWRNRPDRGPGD
jgi:hypothetical protein